MNTQNPIHQVLNQIETALQELYELNADKQILTLSPTKKEFDGDYTFILFPLVGRLKKNPELLGNEIGSYLQEKSEYVSTFNVVKGFLNLQFSDKFWLNTLFYLQDFGLKDYQTTDKKKIIVEFSSPNTNKPLHLGHIRNILLGWSCYKILKVTGNEVTRAQVINDRGIAICKSMVAWDLFANGETPQSQGVKGDHFVGDYYVLFENKFKEEYKEWQSSTTAQEVLKEKNTKNIEESLFWAEYKNLYFNEFSQLGKKAKDYLLRWESHDEPIVNLWKQMNGWVYDGFYETYRQLGVSFDRDYFESQTYLLGKEIIDKGLKDSVFYRKEDSSVWIDLTDKKLDHKLVLRSDGTSVYITQDIGLARQRYEDYQMNSLVYVVADEQNYHFQVLFEIMKKLGEPYADNLYHLNYGMVELPSGRMKSREGTVVDADDLIVEVAEEAKKEAKERGEFSNEQQLHEAVHKVALGALKYHILRVHPKKKMIFDPKESIDMQGQTGPYIQYSYVRANGLLNKVTYNLADLNADFTVEPQEKELLALLGQYTEKVREAAANYDPSVIAHYCYELAKSYHKLWHDLPILKAETASKAFRLKLSENVRNVLKEAMGLLGIEMPERM